VWFKGQQVFVETWTTRKKHIDLLAKQLRNHPSRRPMSWNCCLTNDFPCSFTYLFTANLLVIATQIPTPNTDRHVITPGILGATYQTPIRSTRAVKGTQGGTEGMRPGASRRPMYLVMGFTPTSILPSAIWIY
jgi:hypothetical protein